MKCGSLAVRDALTGALLVRDVHFRLEPGTCLGVVGESGSGKSLTCLALLGLAPPSLRVSGSVRFDGIDLLRAGRETVRGIRGKRIAMIVQQPMTAFDPLYSMGAQLLETLRATTPFFSEKESMGRIVAALEMMHIHNPLDVLKKYPYQLSGGMLQRCMIAVALLQRPDIIIADEPTTALDSMNQREVVAQFRWIREEFGTSLIFVSHDLGVVHQLAQEVLVMKDGVGVEYGGIGAVLRSTASLYPLSRGHEIHIVQSLREGDAVSVAYRETPLLEVRNVFKSYPVPGGFWKKKRQPILRGVNLTLSEGSSVGLIGESGEGKSTLGRLILGLEQPDSGQIILEGLPVKVWSKEHPGQMSVVFQDYTSSANPRFTVEELIREPLDILRLDTSCAIPELLERVGLPKTLRSRYPHELSGGQLQRVCIARAIATKPRFIVFDEAISSLDVSVQAQVLELLLELKGDMTYLFIAHDVQAVTYLCDRILFLHEGAIVESLEKKHLARASSVYAQRLLQSVIPFAPDANVTTI